MKFNGSSNTFLLRPDHVFYVFDLFVNNFKFTLRYYCAKFFVFVHVGFYFFNDGTIVYPNAILKVYFSATVR